DRGEALAELGLWREAAALYNQARVPGAPVDLEFSRRLATLMLAAGDREGYRSACLEVLEEFGDTKAPEIAARVAELCQLDREPVGEADRLRNLARLGMEREGGKVAGWGSVFGDGLAFYRAGQYDKALERLGTPPEQGAFPRMWALIAMVQQRLGHAQE